MSGKPNIFFSHSSRDKVVMGKLKELFVKKTGGTIDIFLSSDGQSIQLGRNWAARVEKALECCQVMVIFVTPNSIDSKWIYFEGGFAYSRNIQVIPVGFLGVSISELAPPLSLLQGFDLQSVDGLNNLIAIANEAFHHQHDLGFTSNDFDQLVSDVVLSAGFGPYSHYIESIYCSAQLKTGESKPLLNAILERLNASKITFTHDPKSEKKDLVSLMGCKLTREDVAPVNVQFQGAEELIIFRFTPRGFVAYYDLFLSVLGRGHFHRMGVHFIPEIYECENSLRLSEQLFGQADIIDDDCFSAFQVRFRLCHTLEDKGRATRVRGHAMLELRADHSIEKQSVINLVTMCFEAGSLFVES